MHREQGMIRGQFVIPQSLSSSFCGMDITTLKKRELNDQIVW